MEKRLIDANKLQKEMENGINAGLLIEGYEEYAHINDMDDCVECVKYADTVLTIPDNPTNGDMIKAMFPNSIIKNENSDIIYITIGSDTSTNVVISAKRKWWNEPYYK